VGGEQQMVEVGAQASVGFELTERDDNLSGDGAEPGAGFL
jgi:hypothetical protein